MCGIAGILSFDRSLVPGLGARLSAMNRLQKHRGPDGEGFWEHSAGHVGFAHCRLSIIDLVTGAQPMTDGQGNWVTFNGEIYNYLELRRELGEAQFRTHSDTEVILHAYRTWGADCVKRFRGMFAFALWDESRQQLFCARDRFGIKPFYFAEVGGRFCFASEIKALLPVLGDVRTDVEGLKEYLAFQFCLDGRTLFQDVRELLPAHVLTVSAGGTRMSRYWDVYYTLDPSQTDATAEERLRDLLQDSVRIHLRSDVPLGAYVSGGLDSSIVVALACREKPGEVLGFNGKFPLGPEYDESRYARMMGEHCGFPVHERAMGAPDFIENIRKVIYHLDCPVAGPGSFSQYMVSHTASQHRKVVLGGQGGDEIFGGYARYLIAYFEQCIKAAIDGTMNQGRFVVTYESIIPNLTALRNYKPLLQEFWKEGLFEPMDQRYFRLINRAPHLGAEIRWDVLGSYSPYETFRRLFHSENVGKQAYFDLMTHFDFKTLLPALLQVEDRVSMAHGLESRVPLLDHELVEFVATLPATIKFKDGTAKHVFKNAFRQYLPDAVVSRKDKMGFPTPLTEWIRNDAREFVMDVFTSERALGRDWVDNRRVAEQLDREPRFGRNIWGLLCLELWQQEFHDRAAEFKRMARAS